VTGQFSAVKILEKRVTADADRLATELAILEKVKHPNIIQLEEVFETNDRIYIVTELVTGGELFDRIVLRGTFTEADAAGLIRKVVGALEYLHSMGIVHRDLKPENLLLKSKDNDTDVKIADFGLAKVMAANALAQTACGTPGYVAPEILRTGKGYGTPVDMWSVGVITYILLSGFPPFYNQNIPLLFESIMLCDFDYPPAYFDKISDDALSFIDSLLVSSPENRLTAEAAMKHKWLANPPPTPLNISATLRKSQGMRKKLRH
jgi:calcium/calmodulin-dependent protein kinase I